MEDCVPARDEAKELANNPEMDLEMYTLSDQILAMKQVNQELREKMQEADLCTILSPELHQFLNRD